MMSSLSQVALHLAKRYCLLCLLCLTCVVMLLTACEPEEAGVFSPFSAADQALPLLSSSQREQLLDIADKAILDAVSGRSGARAAATEFDAMPNRVYVVLWQSGRKLGAGLSQSDNLASGVYQAARHALAERVPAGAAGLDVHIHILGADQSWDDGGYQQGLHGVSLRRKQAVTVYPSWAIETNTREAKLLARLSKQLNAIDPGARPPGQFYFPADHFARPFSAASDRAVRRYYKGSTPQLRPGITRERFNRMHRLARQWLLHAITDEGDFRYLYYPSRDSFPEDRNNMIRQLMSSRGLAELAKGDSGILPLHRRNLAYVMTHWYRESESEAYIWFRDKSKLGANAMALRTLVASPLFNQYRPQAQRLLRGIRSLQQPDGNLQAWYRAPDYHFDEARLLSFYSGEAILALVEYHLRTGDPAALQAARTSQAYFLRRYVDEIDEHYYPAYVPWHAQSLSALYKITGLPAYAEAVFVLTDKLLELQQVEAGEQPDHLGRFYNPLTPEYGSPHASSDGVYTEGLAYAYELAVLTRDAARIDRYRRALLLALHNLGNLQYRDDRLYFVRNTAAVKGAFRIHSSNNRVRVDSVQHALDAFDKVAALMAAGQLQFDG